MSLQAWRRTKLREHKISKLYYFSYIGNFESILEHGILPYNEVERRGLSNKSFAEESVQERRHVRPVYITGGRQHHLHDLVPLYLTPRTPTLYRRRDDIDHFFMIEVSADVLVDTKVKFAFCDGNAASENTRFYHDLQNLSNLPWEVIKAERWTDFDDGKRKRNAEFLVHPAVHCRYFSGILVPHHRAAEKLKSSFPGLQKPVRVDPFAFFSE